MYNKITTEIQNMWQKYIMDNSYIVLKQENDLSMLNELMKLVNPSNQNNNITYADNKNAYDFAFKHFNDCISKINTDLTNEYSNYYPNGQKMIGYNNSKDNIREIKIRYIKDDKKTKRLGFAVSIKVNIKFKEMDNYILLDLPGGTISDTEMTPDQVEKNKQAINIIDNYLDNKLAINLPSFDTSNWPTIIRGVWDNYIQKFMNNFNAVDFTKDNNVKKIISSESDLYNRNNISLVIQNSIINMANNTGLKLKNNDQINFYNTSLFKLFDPRTGIITVVDDFSGFTGFHARDFLLNKNNGIFRNTGKIFLDYSYLSVSAFLLDDNTTVVGTPTHVTNFFTSVDVDFWDKINGANS